ncbi:MAG: hypothetical protein ACKESC_01835, partial [Candidatus Hodgkinia cicadicola]
GVKNAETIIAVNIDVNAPIVAQADYVLFMDMFNGYSRNDTLISWKAKNKQTIKNNQPTNINLK